MDYFDDVEDYYDVEEYFDDEAFDRFYGQEDYEDDAEVFECSYSNDDIYDEQDNIIF